MLDITTEPCVLMPTKTVKLLASNYCNKIFWWYSYSHEENDSVPCLKQWSIMKCQEWLHRHPIDDGRESYNLASEIKKYRVLVAEKALAERLKHAEALDGGKKWQGKYPMLCMMHALVDHNEIKRVYLTRHNLPPGQICLENCNTAAAMSQNVWQLIADKWNNVFSPRQPVLWIVTPIFFQRELALTPCVTLLQLQQKRWRKGGGEWCKVLIGLLRIERGVGRMMVAFRTTQMTMIRTMVHWLSAPKKPWTTMLVSLRMVRSHICLFLGID